MSKKLIDWHIGCSGFHYKEWKEQFYPKGLAVNKWFQYYVNHFNTVESNVTFYRLPTLATLLKWHNESSADFSFCVKAPRLITHYKKFQHVTEELAAFYKLISDGLQEKLACILFQFPPGYTYSPERLSNIVTQADPLYKNVLEFRHTSWWNDHVYHELEKSRITFCNLSYPKFPDNIVNTSSVFYFRFHGVPDLYRSAYTHEYLDNIIGMIKREEKIKTAYLYFNNTAGLGAIENAEYIKSILF